MLVTAVRVGIGGCKVVAGLRIKVRRKSLEGTMVVMEMEGSFQLW